VAARELLGVGTYADEGEIRAAWRRAAFKAHPDKNDGRDECFARARAAYELLSSNASDAQCRAFVAETAVRAAVGGAAAPRKPRVVTRFIPLPAEAVTACRALFGPALQGAEPDRKVAANCNDPSSNVIETGIADHVPVAVAVHGRSLIYQIATPLVRGVNRVSLPTGLLRDKNLEKAEIVTFRSPSAGSGEIVAPDSIRERLFPGARSVHIRFNVA
jgi:hypothetical protein